MNRPAVTVPPALPARLSKAAAARYLGMPLRTFYRTYFEADSPRLGKLRTGADRKIPFRALEEERMRLTTKINPDGIR